MERKVEIGMYVRTECGIAKVIEATEITRLNLETGNKFTDIDYYVNTCFQPWDETKCSSDDIIGEPSFDILDVIESGDIVNGRSVNYIDEGRIIFDYGDSIRGSEVETVLTHDQYELMCYKVLDEEVEENKNE